MSLNCSLQWRSQHRTEPSRAGRRAELGRWSKRDERARELTSFQTQPPTRAEAFRAAIGSPGHRVERILMGLSPTLRCRSESLERHRQSFDPERNSRCATRRCSSSPATSHRGSRLFPFCPLRHFRRYSMPCLESRRASGIRQTSRRAKREHGSRVLLARQHDGRGRLL
jgi:hypothetical protein